MSTDHADMIYGRLNLIAGSDQWPPIKVGLYAPGEYFCQCHKCGGNYIGDKRSGYCYPCAEASYQKFVNDSNIVHIADPNTDTTATQIIVEDSQVISATWSASIMHTEPINPQHDGEIPLNNQ